ncbi:MAG: ketoacyl reductase, partial [Myxococcales bacterium]|nr:ketoacyl reductase [Myxococcales bacterium]
LVGGLAPGLTAEAMTLANTWLPRGEDPRAKAGRDSESAVAPSLLTALTEAAAAQNNER